MLRYLIASALLACARSESGSSVGEDSGPVDDSDASLCSGSDFDGDGVANDTDGCPFVELDANADGSCPSAALPGADLRCANLSGADLSSGNLVDADLTNANLSGANLRATSLVRAILRLADLTDAEMVSANLTEADLA